MTESEWLSSSDPAAMLRWLRHGKYKSDLWNPQEMPSDRKLRLFACACCRQIWNGLSREGRWAVSVAEGFADGEPLLSEIGLHTAGNDIEATDTLSPNWIAYCTTTNDPAGNVVVAAASNYKQAEQAALLRDIFGNRPVAIDVVACAECGTHLNGTDVCWKCGENGRFCTDKPGYLIPTVLSIAQAIYDERAFDRTPVLADALEEAGCREGELLRHLRGEEVCWCCRASFPAGSADLCSVCCPGQETLGRATGWAPLRGPHVRGCFALDLILGKE